MSNLINIGYGNIVNADKIVAIVQPDSAPSKRLMQNAKQSGTAIDATKGRRIRSIMIMESSQIVLSALTTDTLMRHFGTGDPKNKQHLVSAEEIEEDIEEIGDFDGA